MAAAALASLLALSSLSTFVKAEPFVSSSPVIGIFSHPLGGGYEQLPASYVKYIEAAGGRVVPVSFSASDQEIERLASSVNGFLLIGGGDMPPPRPVRKMLDISRQMHLSGKPGASLPVWATCLGFEMIMEYLAEGALDTDYQAFNLSLSLQLTESAAQSRLLGKAPQPVLETLTRRGITFNNHHRGVSPERYAKLPQLRHTLEVLSTNVDSAGKAFVSTVEGRGGLPWYAVQWHPEKNAFETGLSDDGTPFEHIAHGYEAVSAVQYLADFFVSEARRSGHRFANEQELNTRLIYGLPTSRNFAPAYVETYVLRYDNASGRPLRAADPLEGLATPLLV